MAAAHISAHANHELIYHGQAADDILLSLGYNLIVSPNITTVTFSGLVGIPTHGIDILKHPDFGYGQASIGAQVDGSTAINHLTNIIYGARYIHFIPRNTFDRAFIRHKFSIGNIFDILLAFKQTWTHHGYEFGYTARFNYGARCAPFFDDIIKRTNYIRSNLYAVYKYKFMVGPYANRFLLDVGFGRDHSPKLYGNKYIVTVWGSWQINF